MDSRTLQDYWQSQGNYPMPPHQTTVFELPPDLSQVPSLSGSPVSSTYDQFPGEVHQSYYTQMPQEQMQFQSYALPMTPSDFGSDHDSPYGSPRLPQQHTEPVYAQPPPPPSGPPERTHTTSGRRRAQNRAAQRAFRERKEKHARDLEAQLATLSERYRVLENSHTKLNATCDKLRQTIEVLTSDDSAEGEDEDGKVSRRRSTNSDTLRKLLEILHSDSQGIGLVKKEGA